MQQSKPGMRASPLAVVAGILIVVVLAFLIVESRTVSDEYYVAHADRTRTIETVEVDIAATVDSLRDAYASARDVPDSGQAAFVRLTQNNERLQSLSNLPRRHLETQPLFVSFGDELHQFAANGQAFVAKQNAMVAALQVLQSDAPILVRELRANGLVGESQAIFTLAIDLIEHASAAEQSGALLLNEQMESLRGSVVDLDTELNERVQSLLGAGQSIVDNRAAAAMSFAALSDSRATNRLEELREAILSLNQETVQRAELARLLLSACAVLLLAGVALTIVRLQGSYRELNESNTKLEEINTELEERVAARTGLLTKANDELKESQVQLIHAEKMSSLGQMVAGISHEINTPLWYLMNNSSVIQERLELAGKLCGIAKSMTTAVQTRTDVRSSIERGLTDLHRMLADGIEDDIDEAKDLIQDSIFGLDELTSLAQGLKDFSRLDRAIQGQFNVNEGLDKALLIASNRIKNRIEVHKYYEDVPRIHCSPSQINQIFLNLLTNAADAITEDGDLVIRTWQKHGMVGISISDSGVGIPADVLPSIRNPFFTTKEVGKGTGLGLSIVDQIVTKHRGNFDIESEPGKGTCVTIMLPIAEETAGDVELDSDDSDIPRLEFPALIAGGQTGDLPDMAPKLLSA